MYLPYKFEGTTYLWLPLIKRFCFAFALIILLHKTRGIEKYHGMIGQSKFIIQRAEMRGVPLKCISREYCLRL